MIPEPSFLYVEDDPLSREVMQMLMSGLGYPALTVFADSANFVDRVEALSPKPDVIFLDVHLKPYDGFEMLKMLRDHPSYTKKTIIAVTASVMNEEIAQLKEVGFNGAIGKPLDFENFAHLITSALKGEEVWYVV